MCNTVSDLKKNSKNIFVKAIFYFLKDFFLNSAFVSKNIKKNGSAET